MTANYKIKSTTIRFIHSISCDNCKKEIKSDDYSEYQESMHIRFTGGFGSIFGDGTTMETHLCQYCVKDLLGNILKEVGLE